MSSAFQSTPAAPGQAYVRCDTLGPEAGWQIALSPDAHRIAARTGDGAVRLIATDTWVEIGHIASSLGAIDAVAFSPDSTVLALLSAEMGQVTLLNASDGTQTRSFAGPAASTIDAYASALTFSSDGRRLATSLGTIIDVSSGATIDWKTGKTVTSELLVNPENLDLGEAIPTMTFSAGDALLFVDTRYQIGNSPTSVALSLRAPATGQETVLFKMYDRALTGYALSPDGRFVALAKTGEAQAGGFEPGLAVYRFDTGVQAVSNLDFVGTVLGFSHDGQRIFTLVGSNVMVLASDDLHQLGQFAWPDGVSFVGVSPADELVGRTASGTSWWASSTGTVVRTMAHPLDHVSWSSDGAFAAGTGDPAALFDLWRESDGAVLCTPPPRGSAAPALASLGTTLDSNGAAQSADGTVAVHDEAGLHTHSSTWSALRVRATADGTTLRIFGATRSPRDIAVAAPSGSRLYTVAGPAVAAWCR